MSRSGCAGGCSACDSGLRLAPASAGSKNSSAAVRKSALMGSPVLLFSAAALFLLALLLPLLSYSVPLSKFKEALYLLAFALAGAKTVGKALQGIRGGLFLTENFLMTLAAAGAIAIGDFSEAAAIMILYNLGELLEGAAVCRSHRSIAALMETKPDYANLVNAEGSVERVNPEVVGPGELILVQPGEKIALDGEVAAGTSAVNNAALTGEAIPQEVAPGDPVLAGAVNGPGLLRIRVSRPFSQSSLAQIYRLVEESAVRKAPAERFMSVFARRYTPAVVTGALLLAAVPPLVITGADFRTWIYRALVFLVISCPCALVISIPLGYLAGIAAASRRGILVKGGNYLEALRKVRIVAFDKTGTLTEGIFRVDRITPAPGISAQELLESAAHAEAYSTHPLARSIREAYPGDLRREAVSSYQEKGGLGVKAKVQGRTVLAGNLRLLEGEQIRALPGVLPESAVHVAVDGRYAGSLEVGDIVRPGAAPALQQLKYLGVRRTVVLTGDSAAAAEDAARRAGVDLVHASLMPDEKVAHLEGLLREAKSAGGKLAYVGDGVNDAPALSRADIGIAMGGAGSDAAIEAADVVIMDDQLSKIPAAMRISGFTHRIVIQNIIMALGVKALFLTAAALGFASIWGALFADVGVALLAIANAARILWAGGRRGAFSSGIITPRIQ